MMLEHSTFPFCAAGSPSLLGFPADHGDLRLFAEPLGIGPEVGLARADVFVLRPACARHLQLSFSDLGGIAGEKGGLQAQQR